MDAVCRPNVDEICPDFKRIVLPAKDWIKYTDAITRHGANPCIQLAHAGLFAEPFFNRDSNGTVVGPVDMSKESGTHVKAMDQADMDRIANDFTEAAFCAVQAGFNQIMIQCCHGWLLAQFLSPAWNTRTDEFGGSIENRAKFPLQVFKAVREKVGPKVVIQTRISGDYHNSEHYCWFNPLMDYFINIPIARELKKRGVTSYISAVGGHNDPKKMDDLIREGVIDFFSIGRGILADSDLPKKWLTGKEEDVKPCIRCSDCMAGLYNGFYQCNINPTVGQEAYLLNTPSPQSSMGINTYPFRACFCRFYR